MAHPSKLSEYKLLGESGLRVSPICLGAMTWGGRYDYGAPRDECKKIFDAYTSLGGNFIDTANMYHEGGSEEWLGSFMKENENREDLVIATKYGHRMASQAKIKPPIVSKDVIDALHDEFVPPNHVGLQKKNLMQSVDASLRRLQTQSIDLFYVHMWDHTVDPAKLMRWLDDLVRDGKVYHLGISNTPMWVVAECNAIAEARGWTPFTAMQYKYSLLDRSIERDILQYGLNRNVAVVNWDCLGGGTLTGKYRRGMDVKEVNPTTRSQFIKIGDRDYDIVDVVVDVAKEIGCEPVQVAIRWTMMQPGITSPLVGCRTVAQFEQNVRALGITLTEDQIKRLGEVSKIEVGFPLDFIGKDYHTCPWLVPGGPIM